MFTTRKRKKEFERLQQSYPITNLEVNEENENATPKIIKRLKFVLSTSSDSDPCIVPFRSTLATETATESTSTTASSTSSSTSTSTEIQQEEQEENHQHEEENDDVNDEDYHQQYESYHLQHTTGEYEEVSGHFAFCCDNCTCSKQHKSKYEGWINCGQTGNDQLFHRRCCHSIPNSIYRTPIDIAMEKGLKKLPVPPITRSLLKERWLQAEKAEKVEVNKDHYDVTEARLNTCPIYCEERKKFHEIKMKGERIGPIVILDVFSGIGSGIVALKRLGIDIKTVILCDHDKVANFVSMQNHKDDGINYVHEYNTFEKIRTNIDKILQEYGPINLVLGGPPCQDFTGINGYRKGIDGSSGGHLVEFSDLILQKIKNHKYQGETHLFYLGENVLLDKDTRFQTQDLFGGMPHVRFDASDFSPCRRNRIYWTNLPVDFLNYDDEYVQVQRESIPILEDGYQMVGNFCKEISSQVPVKANTFLASESRLDDMPRMLIVKEEGNDKYIAGTYSMKDRENMMGFPRGYVSDPVLKLFSSLKKNAFDPEFIQGESWLGKLDEILLEFQCCNFKFGKPREGTDNLFEVLIGEPNIHRQKQPFFDCEDYAKHLIGNAWSIPVVEHLLKPLKEICKERRYVNFDYKYHWQPFDLCRN